MLPLVCYKNCEWNGKEYRVGDKINRIGKHQSIPDGFRYPRGGVVVNPIKKANGGSITLLASGPSGKGFIEKEEVAVVNMAGVQYPHEIKYWLTLHPEYLGKYINKRKKNNYSCDGIMYISDRKIRKPILTNISSNWYGGSSSLYALDVLTKIGYQHIHLVGVDLSGAYESFRYVWEEYSPHIHVTAEGSPWIIDWADRKNKQRINKGK